MCFAGFVGKWVIDRLREDQQFSVGAETFDMRYVRQAVTDKKTWICRKPRYVFLPHMLRANLLFSWDIHGLVSIIIIIIWSSVL